MAGLKSFKGALSQLYGALPINGLRPLQAQPPPRASPAVVRRLRLLPTQRQLPAGTATCAGEQRAQVKGIKERSLVNKAKNEAKRELEEAQARGGAMGREGQASRTGERALPPGWLFFGTAGGWQAVWGWTSGLLLLSWGIADARPSAPRIRRATSRCTSCASTAGPPAW